MYSIGAVYGNRFALWDISRLSGGKPTVTNASFPEGGTKFRYALCLPPPLFNVFSNDPNSWCPSHHEYFAITTNSPLVGAVVNVYNTNHIHAHPTTLTIAPRPLYVRDFDFISQKGIPRIAAGVGRDVIIFNIGVES